MNHITLCGQGAHNYRLCAPNGKVLLHVNNIGSDNAFKQKMYGAKKNNRTHIVRLANNIAKRLAGFPATHTARQLNTLIEKVINNRRAKWMEHRPNYNRESTAYYAYMSTMGALYKNLKRQRTPAANAQANAVNFQMKAATQNFLTRPHIVSHIHHSDQISYWRWIREFVLPEVTAKLRAQARHP